MENEKIEMKIKAIAEYIGENTKNVNHEYGHIFSADGIEYRIYNEDEKQEALQKEIKNSVWAFNPSFLEDMTGLNKEIFEMLAEKCESANDAVLKLIEKTCGLKKFVEKAVECDGAGHFLAYYDGEEIELDNDLFAYRW
ncbi:hypothetical protein [Siminovitchia sp. 179-K 8D1 HS]|uniref:hypothetical protein n=1 Tax=Siminovitchia sp. 179-K 8D1 HS TaxID=3142385 RepID=UPI00399F7343